MAVVEAKYLSYTKKMKKAIGKTLRNLKAMKKEFRVSSSYKDEFCCMLSILRESLVQKDS